MISSNAKAALRAEPSLDEILAEPIIRLIMQCDGVNDGDMRGVIDRVRQEYTTVFNA